ncbi:sulfurtransferase [Endozoicomonas sp. OPT23]|uniref:sulfurtransferase n=1 Tax=Endozoicomonas sp. OPT23 TaxID=2072845 RepID=UPI00129A2761|nr:sulfurtransferase [Endozoicomonas sp. OPT23]MRI31905.1 sulfurtransferase [Endozoicomonas sp. OPT23]
MGLERLVRPTVHGQISVAGKRHYETPLIIIKLLLITAVYCLCIVRAEAEALIQPEQLNRRLAQGDPVLVLDVRPRVSYLLGHIPKAHNVWRPAYQANEGDFPVSGMRASQTKMEKLLSHLGATPDTEIVLYDDYQSADAARLWWLLKLYGHNNITLLNGGLKAWSTLGFKQAIMPPESPKTTKYRFTGTPHPEYLAGLTDVKETLQDDKAIVLDVRSFEEFTGRKRKSGSHRAGRIPGSSWLAFDRTVNESGFLNPEKLQDIFSEKGITSDKSIIVYCQSGVRSAQTLFVLTQLLGYENVRNYDGSWIEWSWNRDLPLLKGKPETE